MSKTAPTEVVSPPQPKTAPPKKIVKVAGQSVKPPAPSVPGALATVRDALGALGFVVQADPEVGLTFMFEGGQYYVPLQGEDERFYHLLFPNFWPLESDDEYGRALFACDAVNREAKLVKLHTVDSDVWVGVEALHASPAEFVEVLPQYLTFVQDAVRAFRALMLAAADELAAGEGEGGGTEDGEGRAVMQ
ncbi:hypothetical protein LAJ19_10635 [Deinococcus taeanensis]|uniref:hypothetical protein n=1 Tax=Deinococcus taeanensis TaxID=2737050 RepID=UPI001CDD7D60|nr:hypothetical protein [Deinococcus taeanensis]UBV42088.1 hypothetical protein LAJ19_10635 [Deinococcus taeanensis]